MICPREAAAVFHPQTCKIQALRFPVFPDHLVRGLFLHQAQLAVEALCFMVIGSGMDTGDQIQQGWRGVFQKFRTGRRLIPRQRIHGNGRALHRDTCSCEGESKVIRGKSFGIRHRPEDDAFLRLRHRTPEGNNTCAFASIDDHIIPGISGTRDDLVDPLHTRHLGHYAEHAGWIPAGGSAN